MQLSRVVINQMKRKQRLQAAREKGTHTPDEWVLMKIFFEHTCVKCFGESGLVNVEKDHIIPIYQGGSDSITNIQPLCAMCNAAKGPENIDHRIDYCSVHGKEMPAEWLP